MGNKQKFLQYLTEKKKKQNYIDECAVYMDHLSAAFDAKTISPAAIPDFNERASSCSRVAIKTAYQFLDDYAKFIEKEQPLIAEAIRKGCRQIFEQTAKDEVKKRRNDILPISDDVKITPKHLSELSNEQFVKAFGDLQRLIIACYDDIEKDPFAWGYPDYYTTGGYYNRINNILFALVFCGEYSKGVLKVDAAKFFARADVKRHKNIEMMISGFEKMGFVIEPFDKKSKAFTLSCPNNPNMIIVLNAYAGEIDENTPDWKYIIPRNGFSYRFIECPSVQTHETVFLSEFDYMSSALQEIQLWLHAEAAKYGFTIDPNEAMEKGMMLYKKGSKRFLLVGQPQFYLMHTKEIFIKTIFRNVLKHDDMPELYRRFPETFLSNCRGCQGANPCSMRIEFTVDSKPRLCCAYNSFLFKNPTLDDVKLILELFKLENKIK
ncbi:MAG: hypothetical protein FWG82_00185 [Oscillospiraceae bacterium]|nr:hypothetical protein [Oscillospiraceae bacterium]